MWAADPEPGERECSSAERPQSDRSPAMWISHAYGPTSAALQPEGIRATISFAAARALASTCGRCELVLVMRTRTLFLSTLLALIATISSDNAEAQTAPIPAQASSPSAASQDLTGRWDFRVAMGGDRTARGELWLFRRGDEYTGTLAVQGTNTLTDRLLTLSGDRIAMTVDTPEGPVTFEGTLGGNGQSLQGTVMYHHGERYPLSADRRPPTP